ncbi:hypothetical protein DJ010_13360 [Nocardioides silvaticus]|uniref:PA14 domain-containing protein n=1 Tax=Nocardioides silvaticus TaxID=2201891 RepID=A0A316TK82_9ACTN|nr:PA14 domain-containing protein [Nocardioides silvaticus]PWN02682.1 hypothetical protein DJ010_13360 [Nocardioides silvaticus]
MSWGTLRRAVAGPIVIAIASLLAISVTTPSQADQDVIVSPVFDAKQPRVMDGRVYSITSSGPDVVVGGTFTKVRVGDSSQPAWVQPKLFRFSSATGAIDGSFTPAINGNVEAVTYTADKSQLLIAGAFTEVNGQPAQRVARLNLDGTLDTSFKASAGSTVKDFALLGDRLILGGEFGKVSGKPVRGLAAINATTGQIDPTFDLPISESRDQYSPYVQELDVSADGRWLVVGGNFKKVAGAARQQVAVIDLAGARPKVAPWSTDRYEMQCSGSYPDTYIRGVDIAPDSSYFVVNTTGAFFGNASLCDSTARWELPLTSATSGGGLQPSWVDHTGGDTFWAVEVTETAVYVGGHQRWTNNPHPSPGGDNDGPGALARPGIAALDPYSGVPLSWNPTRDRGRGVEALYATDEFLMVGHDTTQFGGKLRQRLALLPTSGGTANPAPEDVQLPVRFAYTTSGDSLSSMAFDGSAFGPITTISSPSQGGVSWAGTRDGFVQHDRLSYFGPSQAFYARSFDGSTVGSTVTNLSTSVGYVDTTHNLTPYDQPYGVAETRTAAFEDGKVLYTKTNDSRLFYRGHSLESGVLEGYEWVASSKDWSGARAMELVGDFLYVAWSDNRLYRFHAPDGLPRWGTSTVVNSGSSSGIPWSSMTSLFATPTSGGSVPPTPPADPTCTGATPWTASYFANRTLAGSPAVVGCDATIDENWGSGSPSSAIPGDDFSARFTQQLDLASPAQVKVTIPSSDDGVRVWVDGEKVVNNWSDAAWTNLSGTSGTLDAGTHKVTVEYYERGGSARLTLNLQVLPTAPPPTPDTAAPDSVITAPANKATVPAGVVTATGTATDDKGVAEVRVAVRNRDNNLWLQADGSWGTAYAFRLATLANPGATSTGWTIGVNLPAAGSYAFDSRARDAAGNLDGTAAWRPFSVS